MRAQAVLILALLGGASLAGCVLRESASEGVEGCQEESATVYENARVWTADPARPTAEAFAVRNGTFVKVGTRLDAQGWCAEWPRIDLDGLRVVPGLIDSHSHLVRVASSWGCATDSNPFLPTFDNTPSNQAAYEASRAQIAAGHVQTNQSGRTPVDGRTTVANKASAARGLECAMQWANAMGLTMSVEAGSSSWDYFDLLRELEAAGKVTLRHSLYLVPPLLDEAIQRGVRTGHGSDLVRIAGIKYYADGWLGPRTSALLQPYSDRPTSRGVLFLEQAEADDWVGRAHKAGLKVATHTIGDQGVAVLLNAYRKAMDASPGAEHLRHSFEHAQVLQPRFVDAIREADLVVSYQVSFATTDQRFAESALGGERVRNAYVWKTLYDEGIVLAGGSDFPIEVMHPLWGLQRVVTRQELDGTPPGGWFPAQKLSVEEALTTMTRYAAFNVFMEDRVGRIAEGMLADFVVLDKDVLQIPANEIATTCVSRTYVAGQLVYDGTGPANRCAAVRFNGAVPLRAEEDKDAWEVLFAHEARTLTRLE